MPSCDLQLRSYNVRNVEFFADFALRAAYYLNLPAAGPVPLPRITERWTVPRGNFVHKKSQENFERITLRRLVQIKDGHPETIKIWLAFLRKHAYYGVGMKANVWEHEKLGQCRRSPSRGLRGYLANSIDRSRKDHGCQSWEFEECTGAEVGALWKKKKSGDIRKGLWDDEERKIPTSFRCSVEQRLAPSSACPCFYAAPIRPLISDAHMVDERLGRGDLNRIGAKVASRPRGEVAANNRVLLR